MPIYEYECDGCHTVFEVRQKVSDPAPKEHSCGSTEVRRILSATSFVLKGTGWYATDYGNRKDAGAHKDGAESGKSEPKGNAKKDAAAKSESPGAAAKASSEGGSKAAAPSAQKTAKP